MAQPALGFSSRRVTVGNTMNGWLGTPDLGKGFWHLFRVREAPAVRGVCWWQALWPPPSFCCEEARLSMGGVGLVVFSPSREGTRGQWRWRAEGGGWMWVVCFPFLWCWFRFSDGVFSTPECKGPGPRISLRVMAPEGSSEAESVLFASVSIMPALAHPCSLASLALGPYL